MSGKLKDKQEAFCREYIIDLNATQACIRVGYSAKTANRTGCYLLTNPDIQARISELTKQRNQKAEINAQYVLNRLVEIDLLDVADILDDDGNMLPVKQWPISWRRSITGIDVQSIMSGDVEAVIKKIKWPDKLRNLELLGKHINVNAFSRSEEEVTVTDNKKTITIKRVSRDE